MKRKTSKQETAMPDNKHAQQTQNTVNLSNAFLLKGNNTVEPFTEDHLRSAPVKRKFRSVKEMEQVILKNGKSFFGQHSFLMPMPKKYESLFGQGFAPSGFILDLGDFVKPKFYILQIFLSKQTALGTALQRVAKYISGLNNQEVVERLCEVFSKDKQVTKELLTKLKPDDIPYYLKAAIIRRAGILLLTDVETTDLSEVLTTFSDNGQPAKQIVLKKYGSNGHTFCIMSPPFAEINSNGKKRTPNAPVTEEYHLEKATDEVKAVYKKIKSEMLKINNQLQFNPQKYYISMKKNRNLAFFHFSRKRISLVVMNPEKETRKQIKHHEIKTLTEKVQKFWNGQCCTIVIEGEKHLQEAISLLKKLVKA